MPAIDEREVLANRLRFVLEKLARAAEEVPPDRVDHKVLADGNTPAMIAGHLVGAVRGYAIGIGCGRPEIDRDRRAEFASAGGTPQSLAAAFRDLAAEAEAALTALDPTRLDEVVLPPPSLFGLGEPEEMSRRQAIVAAIAHAAEHLGELQFIKDYLRQEA